MCKYLSTDYKRDSIFRCVLNLFGIRKKEFFLVIKYSDKVLYTLLISRYHQKTKQNIGNVKKRKVRELCTCTFRSFPKLLL